MKKKIGLRCFGLVSFVLVVAAFLLMLLLPSATYTLDLGPLGKSTFSYSGMAGIFGKGEVTSGGKSASVDDGKLVVTAVIAFSFYIAAMVFYLVGAFLILINRKAGKVAACINFFAAILAIVAGVLTFFEATAFAKVNGGSANDYKIGTWWLASGIIGCVAGVSGFIPGCADIAKA